MKPIQTIVLGTACLLAAACNGEAPAEPQAGGSQAGCSTRAYENIGGPISLINQDGERVTQEDFKGKPTLIYFGFTYCPDVCPSTLVAIANAYDALPEDVEPPQTVLISVDPERDTPEALAKYVSNNAFPDNLVGLTGTPEEIQAAADEFYVGYEKIETPDSLSDYTMDHTSLLYLMDEDWALETFFAEGNSRPDEMATCLAQLLKD
ncbi:SCO family protein [Henriciella aquimarina]|uniref:SCO family protein n=1 Tax=Henriciella aquimarina TaxID=545261 RepID=UPI000A02BC95|nr:SCO family protein [Henriciella aquimarina]